MIRLLGEVIWLLKVGVSIVLLLMFLLVSPWLAVAQSPDDSPPLEISKKATVDMAVAGDTLTYYLMLTNTGQIPLAEVIVSDTTPTETTLFGVNSPPGWLMTTPGQGHSGQVIWQAEDPFPPGAEVTLEFIVTINPNSAGPIINDTYSARVQGWPEPITGPPIITELLLPTPTWTPPLVPTETPTGTPTKIPIGRPTGAPTKESSVTPAATATSPPVVALEQVQTPTPIPFSTSEVFPEDTSSRVEVGIIILAVLGGVVIAVGLIVLIGRRASG